MTKPKFNEGDTVTIVNMPGRRSSVGKINKSLVGRVGKVLRILSHSRNRVTYYRVDVDDGWYFSARNLQKLEE